MTLPRDEQRWSAYIDGEMSASESAAFDEALLPEEREQLHADIQIETELAELLGTRVACSEKAWRDAMGRVNQHRRAHEPAARKLRRYFFRLAPLAALGAAAVLVLVFRAPIPDVQFLSLTDEDVSALATPPQVSESVEKARNFLAERAVHVDLDPLNLLDTATTPYALLKPQDCKYRGELVVELLFRCADDGPAKVVIARRGGPAAGEIGRSLAQGKVRAARTVGNFLIALIGKSAPKDLIGIVDDPGMRGAPPSEYVEQDGGENSESLWVDTEDPDSEPSVTPEVTQIPLADEPESIV